MSGQWRLDHDPFARPLGCNGKYGVSGVQRHKKAGTAPCRKCRESCAHYRREQRRGGIKPRTPQPCGTYAAVDRHKRRGEPLDFKCRVAQAKYRAELREKARHGKCAQGRHYMIPENVYTRPDGGIRCRECGRESDAARSAAA